MKKIIKITEQQYNLINGNNFSERKSIIDEAMHYPKFLDNVVMEIQYNVNKYIDKMIKKTETTINTEITLNFNVYFNKIKLNIHLNYNQEINDKKLYNGFSNSNETLTTDNKLDTGYLEFVFPVSNRKQYDITKIDYTVSHEVNHLYDDWNDLIRGGKGMFTNEKNIVNTDFLRKNVNSNDGLLKNIAWVCYMELYTESNSFTTQLMSELKGLKCNHSNVKEKFKETIAYQNLKKTENELFKELDTANDFALFLTNSHIISYYRKTSVPKLNIEQFNADRYRNMLSKWTERTLYKISKRYFGVVQLYCDELTENYFKSNCLLIHE